MSNQSSEVITATGGDIAISSTSSAFDTASKPVEETNSRVSKIATSNENAAVLAVENSGILDESKDNFTFADDSKGKDPIKGGAGNDTIFGRTGSDRLSGGAGNDFLAANSTLLDIGNFGKIDPSVFDDFNGKDTLNGGTGNDTIFGGTGSDEIRGSAGDDFLAGDNTALLSDRFDSSTFDKLVANDTLNGGTGNDTIFGGFGSDKIRGGAGNDILRGGLGNDTINGGAGTDVVEYSGSRADYSFSGSAGNLTVSGNDEGTDNIIGVESIVFLATNESVSISDIV